LSTRNFNFVEGCLVIYLMCNFAHVYKTMCVVPCNFQVYKAIIAFFVIAFESWHFKFCTRFCLSLYANYFNLCEIYIEWSLPNGALLPCCAMVIISLGIHPSIRHFTHCCGMWTIFVSLSGLRAWDHLIKHKWLPPTPGTTITILTLKGCGVSIYGHVHNLYGLHQVSKPFSFIYMFDIWLYTLSCVREIINLF
jgi:hypothetical protein